ncbi:hypothetical protein D3C81_1862870 [compost metagenome]
MRPGYRAAQLPGPVFRALTPVNRHREGHIFLWAVVTALTQSITTEIFVVVPEHIVQADGHPAIIFIDQFVVIASHPTGAPVIIHILTGQ